MMTFSDYAMQKQAEAAVLRKITAEAEEAELRVARARFELEAQRYEFAKQYPMQRHIAASGETSGNVLNVEPIG